jgi:hypothetical protein
MATIKDYRISRDWGERPTGNCEISNEVYWNVEKGQQYDLVQFSINELDKEYYWITSVGVPVGTSEKVVKEIIEEYAKEYIDEESIKSYRSFLEDGEKWGWD